MLFACTARPVTSPVFATEAGAIQGFDPVAYFTQADAIKGSPDISYQHQGETWYFVSEEHRELFMTDPEKYTPQFGGYCAYGMSRGYKAQTEPQAWSIVDGKLYLNYNLEVRDIWNQDRAAYLEKAIQNWPTVKDSEFKP